MRSPQIRQQSRTCVLPLKLNFKVPVTVDGGVRFGETYSYSGTSAAQRTGMDSCKSMTECIYSEAGMLRTIIPAVRTAVDIYANNILVPITHRTRTETSTKTSTKTSINFFCATFV